ncbi:hypothetical protein KC361_g188 [Hortaea werneckii]|nr:hypothetical protein KC361_g188 [Hortaea werneckii]
MPVSQSLCLSDICAFTPLSIRTDGAIKPDWLLFDGFSIRDRCVYSSANFLMALLRMSMLQLHVNMETRLFRLRSPVIRRARKTSASSRRTTHRHFAPNAKKLLRFCSTSIEL